MNGMAGRLGLLAAVLALLLLAGGAQGKDRKDGGSCAKSFDHCYEACLAKSGRGKASRNNVKCAKHCTKKKC